SPPTHTFSGFSGVGLRIFGLGSAVVGGAVGVDGSTLPPPLFSPPVVFGVVGWPPPPARICAARALRSARTASALTWSVLRSWPTYGAAKSSKDLAGASILRPSLTATIFSANPRRNSVLSRRPLALRLIE